MTLSQDEKRIKIAEACGFEKRQHKFYFDKICFVRNGVVWASIDLPDYFNDLNACHDMEKALPRGLAVAKYEDQLILLCEELGFHRLMAPSHVRAEAFGLAMGLWT